MNLDDPVTINNTMIYVYELPPRLSDGFCFGGGRPITFQNVDWMNGFDKMTRSDVEAYIKRKSYIKPDRTYLVCSPDNDMSFTFVGGKAPAAPHWRRTDDNSQKPTVRHLRAHMLR